MDKKELQYRAGINEDFRLSTGNLTQAIIGPGGVAWEMDGKPPAPSEIEEMQVRAGIVTELDAFQKRQAAMAKSADKFLKDKGSTLTRHAGPFSRAGKGVNPYDPGKSELGKMAMALNQIYGQAVLNQRQLSDEDMQRMREIIMDLAALDTEVGKRGRMKVRLNQSIDECMEMAHALLTEAIKVRKLDKFENQVVSLAMKIIDEKIDPVDAAMDLLDAVNEKIESEDLQERAGMPTRGDAVEQAAGFLALYFNHDTVRTIMERAQVS